MGFKTHMPLKLPGGIDAGSNMKILTAAQVKQQILIATMADRGCPAGCEGRIVLVNPTARRLVPLGGRNHRKAHESSAIELPAGSGDVEYEPLSNPSQ